MRKASAAVAALLLSASTFYAQNRPITGGQANRGAVQNIQGNTIPCNSLLFSVSSPTNSATGQASGKTNITALTCVRLVDQIAVENVENASTHKLVNVTLTWSNQITAVLTNAEVSSVQFTTINNQEVAEIAFNFQRMELTHTPSNTRVLVQ
jgi:type VI protein secretion system component Hcp